MKQILIICLWFFCAGLLPGQAPLRDLIDPDLRIGRALSPAELAGMRVEIQQADAELYLGDSLVDQWREWRYFRRDGHPEQAFRVGMSGDTLRRVYYFYDDVGLLTRRETQILDTIHPYFEKLSLFRHSETGELIKEEKEMISPKDTVTLHRYFEGGKMIRVSEDRSSGVKEFSIQRGSDKEIHQLGTYDQWPGAPVEVRKVILQKNEKGQITKESWMTADGKDHTRFRYSYGKTGRITRVEAFEKGAAAPSWVMEAGYSNTGKISKEVKKTPEGVLLAQISREYDFQSRLISESARTSGAGWRIQFGYNKFGKCIQFIKSVSGSEEGIRFMRRFDADGLLLSDRRMENGNREVIRSYTYEFFPRGRGKKKGE